MLVLHLCPSAVCSRLHHISSNFIFHCRAFCTHLTMHTAYISSIIRLCIFAAMSYHLNGSVCGQFVSIIRIVAAPRSVCQCAYVPQCAEHCLLFFNFNGCVNCHRSDNRLHFSIFSRSVPVTRRARLRAVERKKKQPPIDDRSILIIWMVDLIATPWHMSVIPFDG